MRGLTRSFIWGKISYLLNWSPVWCVFSGSLSGERLRIFKSFQQKVLSEKLQYVYMIITALSLVSLLSDIAYGEITERRNASNNFDSWYILGLSIANIFYHTLLFFLFKVNVLKRKAVKVVGCLNVLSLILQQLFFRLNITLLSSSNSLTMLTLALAVSVFQNSVLLVYFQDSFLLSMFFWIVVSGLATGGVLSNARDYAADFGSVVSFTLAAENLLFSN